MNKYVKGFTLVELMIVMAIAAILAAVALPVYQNQVNQGRRADGHNALINAAALQERFYSDNGFYGTIAQITGVLGQVNIPSGDNRYNVTVVVGANRPQAYTLTATPSSPGGANDDPTCGALTYTQLGVRGSTVIANPQQAVNACW